MGSFGQCVHALILRHPLFLAGFYLGHNIPSPGRQESVDPIQIHASPAYLQSCITLLNTAILPVVSAEHQRLEPNHGKFHKTYVVLTVFIDRLFGHLCLTSSICLNPSIDLAS